MGAGATGGLAREALRRTSRAFPLARAGPTFRWGLERRREVDALEFTRGGDQVVLGARGPSMTEVGGEPLGGQIFNVFTLRDGRIVRIDDYRGRNEALAAAGVTEDAGWR